MNIAQFEQNFNLIQYESCCICQIKIKTIKGNKMRKVSSIYQDLIQKHYKNIIQHNIVGKTL